MIHKTGLGKNAYKHGSIMFVSYSYYAIQVYANLREIYVDKFNYTTRLLTKNFIKTVVLDPYRLQLYV